MLNSVQGPPTGTLHRNYPLTGVCRQLLRGKSLTRALFNMALSRHSVSGRVLDIGSKHANGSYYDFLGAEQVTEFVYTDLEESPGVVRLDVEEPFPLPDSSFDSVLALNLFEHVYDYTVAPREIFRILREGGRVFVVVPFMHEFHADSDDYYRFTDSALKRIWEGAGFQCVHMEAVGEGILSPAVTKLAHLILPRPIRRWASSVLYLSTAPVDRLLARVRPPIDGKTLPVRFALAHLAVFQRPI